MLTLSAFKNTSLKDVLDIWWIFSKQWMPPAERKWVLVKGWRAALAPYPVDVLGGDGSGRVRPDEEHTYSSQSNIFSLRHKHFRFFSLCRNRIYSSWRALLSYECKRMLGSQLLLRSTWLQTELPCSSMSLLAPPHALEGPTLGQSLAWTLKGSKRICSITASFQNRCSSKHHEGEEQE